MLQAQKFIRKHSDIEMCVHGGVLGGGEVHSGIMCKEAPEAE